MKFAIQINSDPWRNEGCNSAYQFIRAALEMGHEIVRVFFYYEGAYNGLGRMEPAEDERVRGWSILASEYNVDLVICIAAAQRRGLLAREEAPMAEEPSEILAEGFRIAGLGLWVEACLKADRVLVFGG